MNDIKVVKGVKRITVLKPQPGGTLVPVAVYRRGKKRKRQSLPMLEKLTRRAAEAGAELAGVYLQRHNRSNERSRDGWLRDLQTNVLRANLKSRKALRLSKLA
jgi:hypothetical protein